MPFTAFKDLHLGRKRLERLLDKMSWSRTKILGHDSYSQLAYFSDLCKIKEMSGKKSLTYQILQPLKSVKTFPMPRTTLLCLLLNMIAKTFNFYFCSIYGGVRVWSFSSSSSSHCLCTSSYRYCYVFLSLFSFYTKPRCIQLKFHHTSMVLS